MRRLFVRSAGAVALVGALTFGSVSAFAAGAADSGADTPNALPASAISATVAQQDALAAYPGGAAVADGVNDQNGVITYGYSVTQNGATYDVQVNALTGAIVQADAGGTDGAETGAAATGGAQYTTLLPAAPVGGGATGTDAAGTEAAGTESPEATAPEADGPGGPNVQQGSQQGGNSQQNGNF